MADIHQELGPDSVVPFTGVTDRGKEWLKDYHHDTTVRFDMSNQNEKAKASQLSNRAIGDGLTFSSSTKK
jgi:hypothetical protein